MRGFPDPALTESRPDEVRLDAASLVDQGVAPVRGLKAVKIESQRFARWYAPPTHATKTGGAHG